MNSSQTCLCHGLRRRVCKRHALVQEYAHIRHEPHSQVAKRDILHIPLDLNPSTLSN